MNDARTGLGMTITTAATVLVAASSAFAGGTPTPSGDGGPGIDQQQEPEVLELQGVVRDFRERTAQDGHPDFEQRPALGFGLYCGNVSPMLSDSGKPVFTGNGFKVNSQWMDSAGRPICYLLYGSAQGDMPGSPGGDDTGGIYSEESFNMWFQDTPGINISMPLTLVLPRGEDGVYVFDDKDDPQYSSLGGFFPVEDQLFGNPGGSPDRNFHFTFELHTEFVYDEDDNQIFKFIGDDDVWVFVNGQLVIDLGGVHGATEQYVDLNRLGLTDGNTYTLDFFFAERHRTQSNFRIETNLALVPIEVPSTTAAFD